MASDSRVYTLGVLNPPNRRIRSRMYGGVEGRSRETPPDPDCRGADTQASTAVHCVLDYHAAVIQFACFASHRRRVFVPSHCLLT
jgi:hypothetical protein